MKKLLLSMSMMSILLVSGVMFASAVGAQSFITGTNVNTAADETIDATLFTAGQTLNIDSDVNGDVFCAGQTVNISGNVSGDIICAAQTLNISGEVAGDVRLAGQSINLSATVAGNASIAGGTFVITENGSVGGDVAMASGEVTLDGSIGRDLALAAGDTTIRGEVGRNIIGSLENLELADGATIGGSIEYTSANELIQSDNASVAGEITRNEPAEGEAFVGVGLALAWFLFMLGAAFFTSIILVLLFPKLYHRASEIALETPWKPLLVGIFASIVAPFALMVLAVSLIGLPLAIVFGLMWIIIAMLSGTVSAYVVGRTVLKNSTNPIYFILAGSGILLVLYIIPFVQIFAILGAFWFGVGTILIALQQRYEKPVFEMSAHDKKLKKQAKPKIKSQ